MKRRIEIELKLWRNGYEDRLARPLITWSRAAPVFKAVHLAFGADLWVNKQLRFKDGEEVCSTPFEHEPERSEM